MFRNKGGQRRTDQRSDVLQKKKKKKKREQRVEMKQKQRPQGAALTQLHRTFS